MIFLVMRLFFVALGGSLIEHCMILAGLNFNAKLGHDFRIAEG